MRVVHLTYLFRIPKHVPPMRWYTPDTSFVYPNMYPLCVWFTSGTSFVYPNMYPHMRLVHLVNLFRIPKYVPLCVGSPQVPLSYTQVCTPYALVHLRYLFRIPKYVPPMRWFTSGTSFVYPNMYTLCVWFTSGTSFVYPNMYPHKRLVHLVNLFRIPKYVPLCVGSPQVPLSYTQVCTPYALIHLRYLFRIPKYVPPMRWFTSGTSFVYPNMYTLCVWFTSGTSFVYPNMYPHMRLVHLVNLFRIPKYVPLCVGSPQVPLSYTQVCTPYALVHLRYLFRIHKYVHPMRLVHLSYLFRIPKYVPPMRLVR